MERMAAVGGMVKHDPKSQKCTHCECSWTPGTHHKILMLLLGKYSWTCPRCGAVMTYRLINHVVKVDSKKVLNERIWENG